MKILTSSSSSSESWLPDIDVGCIAMGGRLFLFVFLIDFLNSSASILVIVNSLPLRYKNILKYPYLFKSISLKVPSRIYLRRVI